MVQFPASYLSLTECKKCFNRRSQFSSLRHTSLQHFLENNSYLKYFIPIYPKQPWFCFVAQIGILTMAYCHPSLSDQQIYYIFRFGNPNLILYFPRLLFPGGKTPNTSHPNNSQGWHDLARKIQAAKPWVSAIFRSIVGTICGFVLFPKGGQMSHAKIPPTFHCTGWLKGILIMVYYNPYITG